MFPYHLKLLFKLSFYTKAIVLRKKFQLENNFNNTPCMSQLNRRQESLFSLNVIGDDVRYYEIARKTMFNQLNY